MKVLRIRCDSNGCNMYTDTRLLTGAKSMKQLVKKEVDLVMDEPCIPETCDSDSDCENCNITFDNVADFLLNTKKMFEWTLTTKEKGPFGYEELTLTYSPEEEPYTYMAKFIIVEM